MQAAFFDVDGTLANTNVVKCYLDVQSRRLTSAVFPVWLALFIPRIPYYLLLDAFTRAGFNEAFFRNYQGMSTADLKGWANEAGENFWSRRMFPGGKERLEYHRSQGHMIVLVSGGIEQTVRPLAGLVAADRLECAQLRTRGNRFTGGLVDLPLAGPAKAEAVRRIGAEHGVDLGESYAYGDSYADREFLGCVGHPTVVNGDFRLRRHAKSRGWPMVKWAAYSPTPHEQS